MWQNPNYNPYAYPQNIQNVTQQVQKQASCYFVKAPEELAGVNIMPNIFYIGINREGKEIYVRRMNNDGNIEVETYTLSSGKKEKTDIQAILERLDTIESKLKGVSNESVTKSVAK